jgi:hypothetical protein
MKFQTISATISFGDHQSKLSSRSLAKRPNIAKKTCLLSIISRVGRCIYARVLRRDRLRNRRKQTESGAKIVVTEMFTPNQPHRKHPFRASDRYENHCPR